jgi:alpha-amylase/alpha-mannosidase (GH57 family)
MKNTLRHLSLFFLLALMILPMAACQAPELPATPGPEQPTQAPPTAEPTQPPPTAAAPTAEPTQPPKAGKTPLYLNLIWHQHQPRYYVDPDTGVVTRTWVRAHATKDYYDMAAMVKDYPNVKFTINLTPALIEQLDALSNGQKDIYWVLGEKPVDQLTDDEKRFILTRFFDANWQNVIPRFPRYQELLTKRGTAADPDSIDAALAKFSDQDIRDLQVLWNLAWIDPDFLAQEPLKALVDKGRNYDEADKQVLFTEIQRIVDEVLPLHRELLHEGRIGLITSPLNHPILPLIFDTNQALIGDPEAKVPDPHFAYPNDAIAQLKRARQVYRDHFGADPVGLWPSEGAVSQAIVGIVGRNGFLWMASGEDVLAPSLGMPNFTRGAYDVVEDADALYRPYIVTGKKGERVYIFFRDRVLSDKIGFNYAGMAPEAAAQDFMESLRRIQKRLEEQGAEGPHIVSVILDGENAWEHYPNDGKDFLNALYSQLDQADDIQMITPTEYITLYPEQRELENLWAGSWFSSDFGTWIGEDEELKAWTYLRDVRSFLAEYDLYHRRTPPSPEALQKALEFMYAAEGSDWFWWYGQDQDSGDDAYFDLAFRSLLMEVYRALEVPVPDYLQVPIVTAKPAQAEQSPKDLITPVIDGQAEEAWAQAGRYVVAGGAQARSDDFATDLYIGFDKDNLYLRLDAREPWSTLGDAGVVDFYLGFPNAGTANAFTRTSADKETKTVIGFPATHLVQVNLTEGQATLMVPFAAGKWQAAEEQAGIQAAVGEKIIELALPWTLFPAVQAGDALGLRAVVAEGMREVQLIPREGPARVSAPDLSNLTLLLDIPDKTGDDYGPGSYTYPTDAVFKKGVFDLEDVKLFLDPDNEVLVARFDVVGPIDNPWGSPNGLALQTFDLYIDVDPGQGTGCVGLYKGRNARLSDGFGWEFMFTAEGWEPGMFVCQDGQAVKASGEMRIIVVDAQEGVVDVRVPLSAIGPDFDPASAGYLALVLSQEGAGGDASKRGRVRDITPAGGQWVFGGAPDDTNHTRIIDAALPEGVEPSQEAGLSDYTPSQEDFSTLPPEAFGQLPMVVAK